MIPDVMVGQREHSTYMLSMLNTRAVFQRPMSWLKAAASSNLRETRRKRWACITSMEDAESPAGEPNQGHSGRVASYM